jgi:2-iminobutanoate/2-iminopropanoate deaminase
MKIDRIQPEGMSVRIQQGKPAYSHVVTVTGPGKTIYIAGQLARDTDGNIVGPGNMRAQLEQPPVEKKPPDWGPRAGDGGRPPLAEAT